MCDSSIVYAHDDDGVELNAEFAVHPDGSHLSLILESAGGGAVMVGRVTTSMFQR